MSLATPDGVSALHQEPIMFIPARITAAAVLALAFSLAHAQNTTSGLNTVPGMSGESSGTVTGSGSGREGAFGTPADAPNVGARGATDGSAKGKSSGKGSEGAGRGAGTGSDKRGSAAAGADPR
jgi:hypothetical protein